MPKASLITRLQKGDKTALEEVYKAYRRGFINWITYSHKCSDQEAVDIFQYSIISFYENVVEGTLEEMNDAGIKTYLYSIGKNKLLADNRKQSKISYQEELEDVEFETEDLSDFSNERKKLVHETLSKLGEPCSQILKLFYFNNLTPDEIAEIMDYKNGNTVKNLKYKCIQRVKKELNRDK
jgi:RNA polymerase sigma factor (sigma-70 family)